MLFRSSSPGEGEWEWRDEEKDRRERVKRRRMRRGGVGGLGVRAVGASVSGPVLGTHLAASSETGLDSPLSPSTKQ